MAKLKYYGFGVALVSALALGLLTYLGIGQVRRVAKVEANIVAREKAIAKLSDLFAVYLKGTPAEARRSQEESISISDDPNFTPFQRANIRCLAYCRLFVLEKSQGNNPEAETTFANALDWYRRRKELDTAPKSAPRKNSHATGTANADFTPDRCEKWITKWNNDSTNGRGPRFLRDAPATEQTTTEDLQNATNPSLYPSGR